MAAAQYGSSHKEQLRQTIDRVLPDSRDYEDFLAKMRAEGYEIKEGKLLSFRAPGWDRFTRSNKLGADYSREALRERSSNRGGRSAAAKKAVPHAGRKVNMLIDIQAKLAAGKGAGYERWAKIFNLKEAAKTLNFLIENDLTDYDELTARAAQAGDRFDEVSRRIKRRRKPLTPWAASPFRRLPSFPSSTPLCWRRSRSSMRSTRHSGRI